MVLLLYREYFGGLKDQGSALGVADIVCMITTSAKGSNHWVGSIKSPWQVNTVSANCAVYFVKG